MTQFMREVREAMDDEAQRQGRRKIDVSAIVSGRREENDLWGLDVKAWIDEGLADMIIPYTSAPHLQSAVQSWDRRRRPGALRVAGGGVAVQARREHTAQGAGPGGVQAHGGDSSMAPARRRSSVGTVTPAAQTASAGSATKRDIAVWSEAGPAEPCPCKDDHAEDRRLGPVLPGRRASAAEPVNPCRWVRT